MDMPADSNHLLSYRFQPKIEPERPPFTLIATLLLRDPKSARLSMLPATQEAIRCTCQRFGHEGCLHTLLSGRETYTDLIHHIDQVDKTIRGREASTLMLMVAATPDILEQWLILARESHSITPLQIEPAVTV